MRFDFGEVLPEDVLGYALLSVEYLFGGAAFAFTLIDLILTIQAMEEATVG